MKLEFMSFFLISFLLFIFSCKDKEEVFKATGCHLNGFIYNQDSTECICPPATHYNYGSAIKYCVEKGEYVYLFKKSSNLQMADLGTKWLKHDSVGRVYFEPERHFFDFHDCNNQVNSFYPYLHDATMGKLSDGRFECKFRMWPLYPYPWADKTDKFVQGKAHGISNADNTKMDIQVIYSTLDGVVVDTAYIYLYKE